MITFPLVCKIKFGVVRIIRSRNKD